MRIFFQALFLFHCVSLPTLDLRSQELPAETPPWKLVKTFIQETGSPDKSIDREAFAEARLTGEIAEIDHESLQGRWKQYIDVYIDTIIAMPEQYRLIPGDKEQNIPEQTDTIRRSAVAVTTYIGGIYDNLTFFCEQDSIWRIESWRQFPTLEERALIGESIAALDTADIGYVPRRAQLTTLLLSEKDQQELFATMEKDATEVARQLLLSKSWQEIDLYSIVSDSVGEYDPLDDDLSPNQLLIYRLNQSALRRLFANGISKIVRYQERGVMSTLFEIGSVGSKSMGFIFLSDSGIFPALEKDRLFGLTSLAPQWWYYKGKIRGVNGQVRSEPDVPKETKSRGESGRRSTVGPIKEPNIPVEGKDKTDLLRPKKKIPKPE